MNDRVPEQWKPLFTNEEWLQHRLVVVGSWMFFAIAGVVHIIMAMYKPHFKVTP